MIDPSTSKSKIIRKPVAKLIHLETFLGGNTQDSFYTGFSGRIQDGGIFLTTYKSVEQYSPVEVTIHFPQGNTIKVRGTVEWIRESNRIAPDMAPGIGISFSNLQPAECALIDGYLITHPPVFLDNIEVLPPQAQTEIAPDDIEIEALPVNLGPGCDLDEEQIFVSGLARDISHYLNERPMAQLRHRIEQEKSVLRSQDTWTLKTIPQLQAQSFQGGFATEDNQHRVFVCTHSPAPVGTLVRVKLICDNGSQVGCMAEVRWIRKSNPLANSYAAPAGMGVILKNVKETTWQAIHHNDDTMLVCERVDG